MDIKRIDRWIKAHKHQAGKHNQKRHGWRGGIEGARRAMRSGISSDFEGKTTPAAERDAARSKYGMAKLDRSGSDVTKMTLQEFHAKMRDDYLKDNPGISKQEYEENYSVQDRAQEFIRSVVNASDRGKTISSRTLDDIANNTIRGEATIRAIHHDHPETAWPKDYIPPSVRKLNADTPKIPKIAPMPGNKNKIEGVGGNILKTGADGKKKRVSTYITSASGALGKSKIEPEYLSINGHNFYIAKNVIGHNDKTANPIHDYSVRVSPDYNSSAGFEVRGKTLGALMDKLAKLDYVIVPVAKK
jgi:hypothetical protein